MGDRGGVVRSRHTDEASPPYRDAPYRDALVAEIHQQAAETAFWTGRDRFKDRVMDAMGRVPRHEFLPEVTPPSVAYANHPLPIGLGQTIAQHDIVALAPEQYDPKGA